MFKFTRIFLLFQLLVLTVNGADQNSLADVKSDVEALQEDLIEDHGARRGQEMKRYRWGQPASCPYGFTYMPSVDKCYRVFYESHTWSSAAKRCQDFRSGSHLVAVTSAEENSALKTFLGFEISRNAGGTACIPKGPWGQPGNLYWTSGQRQIENNCKSPFVWKISRDQQLPVGFTNWQSGEPNCVWNQEFCLYIVATANFLWNDVTCNFKTCPVCEYKP